MYDIKAIGRVHSGLKTLQDCPRQEDEGAPEASVEIFSEYLDAASDIKPGDNLVLMTWLHQSDRCTLKTHPRNDPDTPLTGIFSTRSPDRPNPIGLHEVVVRSAEGSSFTVFSLEVLDGTPIIDIKSSK